jgi:hypothetical protein
MGPRGGDAYLLAVARRVEEALGLAAQRNPPL